MNREIKFRGKTPDGKWITGSETFIHDGDGIWLSDGCDVVKVIEDTVGQFAGMYDKNGKEIYEGDIVLQQGYNGKKQPMEVKFECGAFIVGYHNGSSTKRTPMLLNSRCVVTGNVFDNKLEDYK